MSVCHYAIVSVCSRVSVSVRQCVGGVVQQGGRGVRASVATLVSMRSYELANYDEPGGLRRVWAGRGYTIMSCIAKRDSFKI